MRTRTWLAAASLAAAALGGPAPRPAAAQQTPDPVAAARADLDALYKGDYRRAFVEKNPDLFGRHVAPELTYSSYDGTTADAAGLKAAVAGRIAAIERAYEHNVSVEHVELDASGQITAVVTLTTVLDLRSPAGKVYQEVSVGTYRDAFVKQPDGSLLEVRAELMRSHTLIANRPLACRAQPLRELRKWLCQGRFARRSDARAPAPRRAERKDHAVLASGRRRGRPYHLAHARRRRLRR